MGSFCASLSLILLFVIYGPPTHAAFARGQAQAQASEPAMPRQISAKEAAALEEKLAANSDNLAAQEALINYYFMEMMQSRKSDFEEKRENHIFWLIEHHPEFPLAGSPQASILPGSDSTDSYQRAKQLWLQQVENHPGNPRILRNAAQFLLAFDEKTARELLEKAWALDSGDAETSSALAQCYDLERAHASSPDEQTALAKKALSLRESALEKQGGENRFYELGDLAKAAFAAGDLDKAQQYASELLFAAPQFKNDWNYGNALHQGNNVLGLIALQRGDVAGAKEHLLAAGQTPGSPQLDSFGPNMMLAKELLEKGERDAVLAYLQSCGKFWKMGTDSLQAWAAVVNQGGTPDFGANLDY